jgi:hypothetical protein
MCKTRYENVRKMILKNLVFTLRVQTSVSPKKAGGKKVCCPGGQAILGRGERDMIQVVIQPIV